jgi:hypothetical protein
VRDEIEALRDKATKIQNLLLSMTGPRDVVNLSPTRSLLRVDPESSSFIDDAKLKQLMDEKTWESITIRTLDVKALDLAIRSGIVSAELVTKATVAKPPGASHFRAVRHDDKSNTNEEKPRRTIKRKRKGI